MPRVDKAKVKRQRVEANRVAEEEERSDLSTAKGEQTVVAFDAKTTTSQAAGLQPLMKEENESLKKLREVRVVIHQNNKLLIQISRLS